MTEHLYSAEAANDLLPWLEEKFTTIRPIKNKLATRQENLLDLLRRRGNNGHSSSEEDILTTREEVDRLTLRIQDVLKEINDLGILVRDIGMGLVDFPGERDGRSVCLCWRSGEQKVSFWHETNVGFTERQPL